MKTRNLTKAGIILEIQIRNKTNYFKKTLTLPIFLLTVFVTSFSLWKQRTAVNKTFGF